MIMGPLFKGPSMSDFDAKRFDRDYNSVRRWIKISAVVSFITWMACLGFVGWVVVCLMRHFGVF